MKKVYLLFFVVIALALNACSKKKGEPFPDSATNNSNTNSGAFPKGDPVKDIDGNIYQTVKIGTQTWMVEDLRTTKYNDGTNIPYVADKNWWGAGGYLNNKGYAFTTPQMCWYNNDKNFTTTGKKFGALYNWYAINSKENGGKNLAPIGWHVPSNSDWTILQNYLITKGYNYDGSTTGSGNDNKIGKCLADTIGWNVSKTVGSIGNTDYPTKRNVTGFSASPEGYRDGNGIFESYITACRFSCSDAPNFFNLGPLNVDANLSSKSVAISSGISGCDAYSIRCIKD